VFNLFDLERIKAWKEFRHSLETSQQPLLDVADFWAQAPFVNNYMQDIQPSQWPGPWDLVLTDNLDDLAIVLGMCYSLKLTKRFSNSLCEIHKSAIDKKVFRYFLAVDSLFVLNLEYRNIATYEELRTQNSYLLWTCPSLR